jgi:DNA-binding NarL/FixJ family response regulator
VLNAAVRGELDVDPDPIGEAGVLRAAVVSADPVYARGLALLLEGAGHAAASLVGGLREARDARVVAGCGGALWVLDVLSRSACDDVLAFAAAHPELGLCILTHRVHLGAARAVFDARPGRVAVLLRDRKPDVGELVDVLRRTVAGVAPADPRLLERILVARGTLAAEELTPTEERVLELVAMGLRNQEIARRIERSEKAVEKHMSRVFAKLRLNGHASACIDRRVTAARLYYELHREELAAGT